MLENKDNNNKVDQESTRVHEASSQAYNIVNGRLNEIESDSDTLEPQQFGTTSGKINIEDSNTGSEILHQK